MSLRIKQRSLVIIIAALALISIICFPVSAASYTTWVSMDSDITEDMNGIWGYSNSDIFAVGGSGSILHYNGSDWSEMDSGSAENLNSVWGYSSSRVFAAGDFGTILRYDGSDWSELDSGSTEDLNSIWGNSGSSIFAAGDSGTILHYDGDDWSEMSSSTTKNLKGIWGSSNSDIFAAGNTGTIVHYNGTSWSVMSSGVTEDINSIWGSSDDDVFAVCSSGIILHYDGSDWETMSSYTSNDLNAVWGASDEDVFAAGDSGIILYYDGTDWDSMSRDTLDDIYTVWGFSANDVFAAGESGTILRYYPPTIEFLSKDEGSQGSTMTLTITGTNFTGATEVKFGSGISVNSFTVTSSEQISVNITIVAAAETGDRNVSVTTPGGSYSLSDSFSVIEAVPAISSISPDEGQQGDTLAVTITGTNLSDVNEVQFGSGISVNSFDVLSTNQVSANITIANGAATGTRDVSITAPGGSDTLIDGFTVNPAVPEITSLSPAEGNQEATISITIDGTNLTGAKKLDFGSGVTVNSYSVVSSNQITAEISVSGSAETGTRDITVTTAGGTYVLSNGFKVKQALPSISSVSPAEGSQSATLTVTIGGSNFSGATDVRLGDGIAVNSFSVLSANQITVNISIIASTETGTRDITVTTPGGSAVLSEGFTVKQAAPSVSSIAPERGSQGESFNVIISGSNLNGATSVSFGTGVIVQNFSNLSQTQISANIQVHEKAVTGVRDVSVTTPGGTATLSSSFIIKEKSLSTAIVILIWIGVAAAIGVFIYILIKLRKKKIIGE